MIADRSSGRASVSHGPQEPVDAGRVSRSRRKRRRGQSLVEFAVVFPIFMLILCGILDFGALLYSRMTIINAARDGARSGITLGDNPTTIVNQVQHQVSGASGGLIADPPPGGVVQVTCVRTSSTCAFTKNTPAQAADVKPGDSVKVVVNYQYRPFFPLLFGNTITISSSVQMSIE
jgi:Flp pilus assembly protein TadG